MVAILASLTVLFFAGMAAVAIWLFSAAASSNIGTVVPPNDVVVDGKSYYIIGNTTGMEFQRGDRVRVDFSAGTDTPAVTIVGVVEIVGH